MGQPSVCRFKSQPYKRHLEAFLAFAGQIAEARRHTGAKQVQNWKTITLKRTKLEYSNI